METAGTPEPPRRCSPATPSRAPPSPTSSQDGECFKRRDLPIGVAKSDKKPATPSRAPPSPTSSQDGECFKRRDLAIGVAKSDKKPGNDIRPISEAESMLTWLNWEQMNEDIIINVKV
ncbi:uncharacterized protein LOC126380962 [Pectinophora gossypiella]|uniref:uncharacterized protein LOC126380962 n=1 Tax=Pectinophora gossypiella TaxID=13191 RepID=UPI00214ED1D0|nr:uncharacterized protein LOC126380962 [Pectinophora gossypiella]